MSLAFVVYWTVGVVNPSSRWRYLRAVGMASDIGTMAQGAKAMEDDMQHIVQVHGKARYRNSTCLSQMIGRGSSQPRIVGKYMKDGSVPVHAWQRLPRHTVLRTKNPHW